MKEDIATRLLAWTNANHSSACDMMDDAAREIVELRNRLAELSVIVRTCRSRSECVKAAKRLAPVTIEQQLVAGYHRVELAWREIRQPTLTDEEREAIRFGIEALRDCPYGSTDPLDDAAAATLRKMLERMQ